MRTWRIVQHISDRVGPKGGEYWALNLVCGHTEFRSKPGTDMLLPALVSMDGKRSRVRKGTAPYRVRCLACDILVGER